MNPPALLEIEDLTVRFRQGTGSLVAVDAVSFAIEPGECVALVGESGSGKSSLARAIVGLLQPASGKIRYRDHVLTDITSRRRKPWLEIQMVFQDPWGSLDPRMSIGASLEEVLRVHKLPTRGSRQARIRELLESVGLSSDVAQQRPRQLSGGQRQRAAIARALAVQPQLLVCDEPVSALDVSIRAQILQLLRRLQTSLGLSYLFITHDLAVVRQIADRVLVMYRGCIVEEAAADAIFARPLHPYTQLLLASLPSMNGERGMQVPPVLEHDAPIGSGCAFAPRCLYATMESFERRPILEHVGQHSVACHNWRSIQGALGRGVPRS